MWWHMNKTVTGIKCKPNRRNQTVELTKWSDCKSNWVAPSLSQNLQKIIGFFFESLFLSKEVSYSLPVSLASFTTIRCPCDKISSLEYESQNLHQRQVIKRLDWWNGQTARATERFPHYYRTYKSLDVLSFEIFLFLKKCPSRSVCAYHAERSLPLDALVIRYHNHSSNHKI